MITLLIPIVSFIIGFVIGRKTKSTKVIAPPVLEVVPVKEKKAKKK